MRHNGSTSLMNIFQGNDVNTKLDSLNDTLQYTLNLHAPVKIIKIKNRPCPFVSQKIKDPNSRTFQGLENFPQIPRLSRIFKDRGNPVFRVGNCFWVLQINLTP